MLSRRWNPLLSHFGGRERGSVGGRVRAGGARGREDGEGEGGDRVGRLRGGGGGG